MKPQKTASLQDPRVKSYTNTIQAIRELLEYLDKKGELNVSELERQQIRAGLPQEEIISADMLRLFRKGKVKTFAAERAEGFCRAMGLKVFILNEAIPETFTLPNK
jgi:hypothetical protein